MSNGFRPNAGLWLACIAIAMSLSGCAGTKVLPEPLPQPQNTYLAAVADDNLDVSLDWVIIRDGPGAWARRADWDEYQLTLTNSSDTTISITGMTLVNSIDAPVDPGLNRSDLVKASRRTAKEYKKEDIEIHAGLSGAGLFATGTTMFFAGGYALSSAIAGGLAGTAVGSVVGPVAIGAILTAPVIVAGSMVRGVQNMHVNGQIQERQTVLPFDLVELSSGSVNVFYPISPSPRYIEIQYSVGSNDQTLVLDTSEALTGLHLEALDAGSEE